MALTDTQRRNAEILAAQGDAAERIAHHVAAPVADVVKALGGEKRGARKTAAPQKPADPEKPADSEKPADPQKPADQQD